MKILEKTLQYIKKNLLHIILFVLVGGAMFTLSFNYLSFSTTAFKFFTGRIGDITFYEFVSSLSIINISTWYFVLISLASVAVVAVTLSMELAMVEKHMRIGSKTLNGLWGKVNDNFISTLFIIILMLAIYEVWAVITSAVMYAIISIFSSVIVMQYVLVPVAFIGAAYGLIYVISMMYLWLPCLQITGFRYYESFKYAFNILADIKGSLLISFSINGAVFSVVLTGVCFLSLCFMGNGAVAYVVAFVAFTYLFAVFTVGQEVAFFEADGLERADLQPSYKRY